MNTKLYQNPISDSEMTYDISKHRYILTMDYVRNRGIDLSLILDTAGHPEPANLPNQLLDRVSALVYANIYNYGRQKLEKEYMLACDPELRGIIRDAMFERLNYYTSSGDLSTKSGVLLNQGTKLDLTDKIPSVVEEMILRPTGLLHRGKVNVVINKSLSW